MAGRKTFKSGVTTSLTLDNKLRHEAELLIGKDREYGSLRAIIEDALTKLLESKSIRFNSNPLLSDTSFWDYKELVLLFSSEMEIDWGDRLEQPNSTYRGKIGYSKDKINWEWTEVTDPRALAWSEKVLKAIQDGVMKILAAKESLMLHK